jgi:hypothetical protein
MSSLLPKTRVIPIGDFYTRLQLEYICYKFRELIYQRPFDKKKFTDICLKKKEKIDQIALENCLPSIFTNVEQQKRYLLKFFGQDGLPNFCYRDDYQSRVKGYWDVFYYFMCGSSIRFKKDSEIELGRVKECIINQKKVIIQMDNTLFERRFQEVTRIFPSNFYVDLFL